MAFQWICPYCETAATVGEDDCSLQHHQDERKVGVEERGVTFILKSQFVHCPNPKCREVTVWVWLSRRYISTANPKTVYARQIMPPQNMRAYDTEIVPEVIVEDYVEACEIEDLSPKAAATLNRRAMQGILRDFYKAKGRTLYDEISAIEEACEPDLWGAMDALREIGNIGAHMQKDINVIVDVDEGEAKALRELIELIIDETYVASHKRKAKIAIVKEIAAAKENTDTTVADEELATKGEP